MKPCKLCGVPKDESEFYVYGNGKTRAVCKACDKQRVTNNRRQRNGTPKVRGRKPSGLTVIVDYGRDEFRVNSRKWQLSACGFYQRGHTPLLLAAYRNRGHEVKEIGHG